MLLHILLVFTFQSPIIIHSKVFQRIILLIKRRRSHILFINALVPIRVFVRIKSRIHFPYHVNGGIMAVVSSFVFLLPLILQELVIVILVLKVMNFFHILVHLHLLMLYPLQFYVDWFGSQYRRQISVRSFRLSKR